MQPNLATLLAMGAGLCAVSATAAVAENIVAPARQTIAVKDDTRSARLAFRGLTVAGLTTSPDGFEVSIRFNEPVQDAIARELSQLVSSLGDASTGYDTLLLRVRAPSEFEVSDEDTGFSLLIRPRAPSGNDARFTELEIRRRTLEGDTPGARELLIPLRMGKPDDASLLRMDASVDYADHNYWSAADKYNQALRLAPDDRAARQGLEGALNQIAPRLEAGIETREIEKGDSQLRSYLSGETPVASGLTLRGRVEYVELDDNAVQAADGSAPPFSGGRTIGEVGLAWDFANRWLASLSLHASEDEIGAGVTVDYRDATSEVTLVGGYNQPTWDYPETIVENGTFDFVGLTARRSFDETWFLNIGLALRRYALGEESQAAVTSSIEAGIRWALPLQSKTQVTLGYAFDAEYSHDTALLPDGGGGFYALLPSGDRALHALDLRVSDQVTDTIFASAFAGYARDNEGSDGIIAGAEIAYAPTIDLRIALNAYYSGISDRLGTSGDYFHAGMTVTRLFATTAGSSDEQ